MGFVSRSCLKSCFVVNLQSYYIRFAGNVCLFTVASSAIVYATALPCLPEPQRQRQPVSHATITLGAGPPHAAELGFHRKSSQVLRPPRGPSHHPRSVHDGTCHSESAASPSRFASAAAWSRVRLLLKIERHGDFLTVGRRRDRKKKLCILYP